MGCTRLPGGLDNDPSAPCLPRPRRVGAVASTAMGVRRVGAGIGRALIFLGVLILLFVAYQLWGTGISEARDQHKLKNDFKTQQPPPPPPPGSPTTTLPPTPEGDAIAIIDIPKISVNKAV